MVDALTQTLGTSPREITAEELLQVTDAERRHGCRVLDVRCGEFAVLRHLPGSARIELDRGRIPVFLMPARGHRVVVWSDGEGETLAQRFTEEGWPCWWCDQPLRDSRLARGPALGAAWSPDPFLVSQLGTLPGPEAGKVCDLGCGNSREGIYLAQLGYDVLAVDRLPDALELAQRRAQRHGVRVRTLEARLLSAADLPTGPFSIVIMFRFFEAELLAGLEDLVAPGGCFVLHTFAAGKATARGPKKDRFRAPAGELMGRLGRGWKAEVGPRTEEVGAARWVSLVARRVEFTNR